MNLKRVRWCTPRKYFIFKADFQHSVESYYSERDAIAILRSCLGPEPSNLVDGIRTDLKAAWFYLDPNHGDPRVVSDVVTQTKSAGSVNQ